MAKRLLSTQRIVNLSSDPGSATAGEVYYNTSINSLKYYDGSQWSVIGSGEGGASVTISETPPVSPELGDLWYESDTAKMFIYYDSTWVEIGGGGGGSAGNSFETINVPNGTDPVAESSTDTLNLTESNGIIITGDSSLDSIQFSTNATASNTASTIVARDSSQSFDITAIDFDTTDSIASATGRLNWDDGEGTLSLGLKGGNVNLQIGQESVALCYNGTGSTIANGSIVYISGAQGQRPSIALADADLELTSSKVLGIATENIANGAEGFVATFGVVNGLDTSAFTTGQTLWLSSTPGQLTATKPSAPVHSVFIGYCLHVNSSSGRIFINPQNGYEIDELHDVLITSVADNHILSYDNATSLWKNQGLAAAIQEVDGASSGIDADLLDGQHGSYYAPINSPTFTGTVVFDDSTTSASSIRIPHGVAPTAPTDGDIWTTVDGVYARVNGETVGPLGAGGGGGGGVTYDPDAPTSPSVGDLWVDSDESVVFLSSNDFATKNSPTFTGAAVFNDGTAIEGRLTAQSGTFYIQAGINSSDTSANLTISRNSTTSTNINQFYVYSSQSIFSGTISAAEPTSSSHLTTKNYVDALLHPFLLGGI